MNAEQLRECEDHLYSRLPILGGRRRRQAVATLARDGSVKAVRLLAAAVVRSDDEELREQALRALGRLARKSNTEAQEMLGALVLDHDHAPARDLALAAGCAPRDPERRALFYFLTDQWEEFESLDFDHRLLRSAYATADEALRVRIRRKARQAGRIDWVEAIAGGRQGRPLATLTPEEWQTTLSVLTVSERWHDLWRLAQEAPPAWSARIARRLREEAWQPDETDHAFYEELQTLAERFEVLDLGGLLQCRAVLQGHSRPVRCLVFSPRGGLLATGGQDHTVRLWSTEGRAQRTLLGHEGPVRCLAVSPNGEFLASAGTDGTIHLWHLPEGAPVATLEGHRDPVTALAVSADGSVLASASEDTTVRLWRLPDGKALRTLAGHRETVTCLAFAHGGKLLASGGGTFHPDYAPEDGDYTVRVWRVTSGREVRSLAGHRNWVSCLAVSPDGRMLASGGSEVLVWQLPSRKRAFDPDAFRLLLLSNLASSWANCLAFAPDGRLLASGNLDRSISFWRLPPGAADAALGHERAVRSLVFSRDGQVLASAGDDHTINLWDLEARRPLQTLPGHEGPVSCLALSPDGTTLASGSDDGAIRLWVSELVRLSRIPVGRMNAREWAWVQATLRDGAMFPAERHALEYVAALLRHHRGADVVAEEGGPRRIAVGEFDVEIEVQESD
jgi:WD40 repeat protein